jgi:hypothetical protein
MPRWLIALCLSGSVLSAFACDDATTEVVDKEVCYSGMRWVGERRGSPEMFPGRDCVGCHIENDGPQLAVGGTIYAYVLSPGAPGLQAQTGTDCFGLEGVEITIEDGEGQQFPVTTNRAGNFYVEGNPDDFAKPFHATIQWTSGDGLPHTNQMFTGPSYGGCAQCHNPDSQAFNPAPDANNPTFDTVIPQARIGLPGNGPGDDGFETIEDELNTLACRKDPTPSQCERLLTKYPE